MIKVENMTELSNILKDNSTVVVDFFADWCRPCSVMIPHVERAEEQLPDVKFIKVNVDESPDIASKYGVMGLPTLIQFRDGQIHDQFSGQRPTDFLLTWVE